MTQDPKDRPQGSESAEGTRVDLGDDLLEFTRTLQRPPEKGAVAPDEPAALETEEFVRIRVEEIGDQLQSAKILLNEGFPEEAKKVLRRILLADPKHAPTRKLLADIHELELKQIFGETRQRPSFGGAKAEPVLSGADADDVLRTLDHDLELGIFSETAGRAVAPFNLVPGSPELREYAENLEGELKDLSAQDRIDLGVAFLEMGLPELAIRQFKAAISLRLRESPEPDTPFLAATALLAHACIQAGQPFEATMIIQGVLQDSDVPLTQKLEFFYQMGRACEAMRKTEVAADWYDQARAIDPHHRDLQTRPRGKRR
ncbi:MAG: hypothetical protein NDJ90_00135 [Oligoflexia bacterium]|nr:hypothetical protein [Oligoflexia bacterium]